MKLLIFCTLISLFTLTLQAQTKYIAYKSHAGNMNYFIPNEQPEDDFGIPPAQITKIKKINDSTIVEYAKDWGSDVIITDTVVNQIYFIDPNITIDSLQKIYPDVNFEGFEKKTQNKTKQKEIKKTDRLLPVKKEKREDLNNDRNVNTTPVTSPKSGNGNLFIFAAMTAIYIILILTLGLKTIPRKSIFG